jgi:predicted AAA+ superfamily ATPase
MDHPLLMQEPFSELIRTMINGASATLAEPLFVFVDEMTYAKDWDLWLKTFYDEKWPVSIAGSSSSTVAMRQRRPESGIGRWDEQYLAPYLFGEFLSLIGRSVAFPIEDRLAKTIAGCIQAKPDLTGLEVHRRRFLLTGGFPELLNARDWKNVDEGSVLLQSQRTLRNDAVERAIYKDIPQAFGVDNPLMLERLLYTLAGQVTGILSPGNLCRGLDGLSQPTFDRYLAYLERSFLVFTLANYSGSEASKQKRGRKLYFVDGAVRNAALQRGLAPLADAGEMGLLIENLAAGHLHALSQQNQVRVYYWRDGNDEVDLIYDHPEFPLAFEIGHSASHHRGGLLSLIARHPKFKDSCYVVAPDAIARLPGQTLDGIGTMPLDLFLLAVSGQAEESLQNRLSVSTAHLGP